MIHYYKSSICKLKADVNLLQKNTDDMLLLLRIQKKILHHIKNAESKIKKINISIVAGSTSKCNTRCLTISVFQKGCIGGFEPQALSWPPV